ncbi:MAG: hypothetical protein JXB50_15655 [Spirochaetes bacterium]|nr:hypothetical protein [Spirochaetota bacterium]
MDYIEEKTPGGVTIKVLLKSWEYTAFNRDGSVIHVHDSGGNVLHKVPVIAFFGKYLIPVVNVDSELAFYKIIKNEVIVPYEDLVNNKRKYLFLKSSENLELIPVRVLKISTIFNLVHGIENGILFNYIVLDKSITKNEIVVIKNRCPLAIIIQTGLIGLEEESDNIDNENEVIDESEKSISLDDEIEKNLNIMSNNPVFLAKIHLKKLALSNVNQILLDFDISSLEAEYMLRFIETMLKSEDNDEEVRKARPKLEAQADAFRFYISLVNKNEIEIRKMIEEINNLSKISSYSTLLAKVKLLFSKQEDVLQLTEYENLLFEIKDRIQSK